MASANEADRAQVQLQAAVPLLGGQLGQLGRVGEQVRRLGGVQPPDDLGDRQAGRRGHQADRRPGRGHAGQAAGMNRRSRADHPDDQALRRQTAGGGHGGGHGPAGDRGGELGVLVHALDEQAALPGAAARHQDHVLAEQQRRVGDRPGQVPLHQVPGQPPVGGGGVEVLHHVGLGHHRQPGQVGELEPVRVDAAEPSGVEGRVRDGAGEQRPQPVPLMYGEPPGVPAEASDVLGHPAADGTRYAGPQQLEVGDRGGGHLSSWVGICCPANQSASRCRRQRAAEGVRVGDLLQGAAGLDGEPQLGQLPGREREVLGVLLADLGEHPRDPVDGPRVQGRVPAVELGIPGGVDPELGDQQPPARRAALGPLGQVEQRGEVPGASQFPGQLRVLRGPLGDPVLEQGQEHVGLAGEARVHRALGEARLVGDLVQGRGVVAPLQEHPAGRGQQQGAVAVVLFGAGQARAHTEDI